MTYAAVTVLFVLALVPWLVGVRRRSLDILELVYPFTALYFVEFGGRMIWILLHPDALLAQTPHPSVIRLGLVPALWYAAAGLAAYLVGYYLVAARTPPASASRADATGKPVTLAWAAVSLYGMGWVFRLPLLVKGWFMSFAAGTYAHEVPALVHSLSYLGVLALLGYALAFAAHFSTRRTPWFGRVLWFGIAPLELAFTFLVGSKFLFIVVLFIPIIIYHYERRALRLAGLAALVLALIFVVTPLVNTYRLVFSGPDPRLPPFPGGLVVLAVKVGSGIASLSLREYLDASVGVIVSRFIGADAFSAVVRAVPVLTDFRHGSTLGWLVKILVPTAVWPAKYGALSEALGPVPSFFGYASFSRGGLSITQPAEFYWNFGLWGVLVGMAAVGAFQRVIVNALRRPRDPLRLYLYAVLWAWMVLSFEGWFYAIYSNVLRILVMGLLISWVVMRSWSWQGAASWTRRIRQPRRSAPEEAVS